jgi:nucleotide-binding universal stress UspA family protein
MCRVAEPPAGLHIHEGAVHLDIYQSQAEEALGTRLKDELLATKRALETAGYRVSRRVRFGKVATEIEEFIQREGIELVVMTTHGWTGLNRFV